MITPFIRGKDLYFRPLELKDADTCRCWINDPAVTPFLYAGRLPINNLEEVDWIEKITKSPTDVVLAICLVSDDRHIGNCGLHGIEWIDRRAEFGILIGEPDMWGKGLGLQATRLALAYAFDTLNLNRVELRVLQGNDRAHRCYEKAGFLAEGRLRLKIYKAGNYFDEIAMAILRQDWTSDPAD